MSTLNTNTFAERSIISLFSTICLIVIACIAAYLFGIQDIGSNLGTGIAVVVAAIIAAVMLVYHQSSTLMQAASYTFFMACALAVTYYQSNLSEFSDVSTVLFGAALIASVAWILLPSAVRDETPAGISHKTSVQ